MVEETDSPNEREIYWIEYYQSFYKGYNVTTGGEGRPKVFTLEEVETLITLYNKKETVTSIAKKMHMADSTIAHKLVSLGYKVDRNRNLRKAVYQLDK